MEKELLELQIEMLKAERDMIKDVMKVYNETHIELLRSFKTILNTNKD